jgi:hypothetical protein
MRIDSSVPPDLQYSFPPHHVFLRWTHETPNNIETCFLLANLSCSCTTPRRLDLRFMWPKRSCSSRPHSGRHNAGHSRIRPRTPENAAGMNAGRLLRSIPWISAFSGAFGTTPYRFLIRIRLRRGVVAILTLASALPKRPLQRVQLPFRTSSSPPMKAGNTCSDVRSFVLRQNMQRVTLRCFNSSQPQEPWTKGLRRFYALSESNLRLAPPCRLASFSQRP